MANTVDVRSNPVYVHGNILYQWGEEDYVQIVENRKEMIEISDSGDCSLYVKFNEVDFLIEALKRVSEDLKNGRYVNYG